MIVNKYKDIDLDSYVDMMYDDIDTDDYETGDDYEEWFYRNESNRTRCC